MGTLCIIAWVTVGVAFILADWWWRRQMAAMNAAMRDHYGTGDAFIEKEDRP